MLQHLKAKARHELLDPAAFWSQRARAALGNRGTSLWLLASDGEVYTSDQQYAPLARHASELRRRFGVVFRFMPLAQASMLPRDALTQFDVVGLKLGFRTPRERAERITLAFRERLRGRPTKLVYFDGDDDLCVQWPALLQLVDLYVKKHVFRDRTQYSRAFIGKNNLTDYVARVHGTSFADDIIQASGVVAPERVDTIALGWNVAYDDRMARLFERTRPPRPGKKDIDIVCRASVPRDNWMFPLRDAALRELGTIAGRRNVLLPTQRVSQRRYQREMRRSRICVSPHGYGEICWRDVEAVLAGCLLVKPDMSHVETAPDIFVAGETYVPVRWDYSDLAERCESYLLNEPARFRIAQRAYTVLAESLRPDGFARTFGALIDRLGLGAGQRTMRAASMSGAT
jgi:hypothetical protein